MVFFLVCCLCMMPIPLAFVRFRKKTVTTGKLALITALNLVAGYIAAFGIMLLLYIALGEGILEGGAYAPGTLLSLFVVYYGMKRSFKDRGMLEGYRPTGQAGHVAPQDIPQKPSAEKGEPAVQEAAAPDPEDRQGGETESSVELLSRIQDEAEAERKEREEAAAAERRGYGPLDPQERRKGRGAPVWLAAVLGGLCVVLAVTAGMLGWRFMLLQEELTATEAALYKADNQVELLRVGIKTRDSRIDELKDELLDKEVEHLSDSIRSGFLLRNIGLVVKGSPYYHTYDCDVFQDASEFWAHNIGYCEYEGYKPCPECHSDGKLVLHRKR